jgi:hypothetical protein
MSEYVSASISILFLMLCSLCTISSLPFTILRRDIHVDI